MSDESAIFVVKTTANQERSVANMMAMVARKEHFDIRAILVPDELKGYILVEAPDSGIVDLTIQDVAHARTVVKGQSSLGEVSHFLTPKPTVTGITEGAIIEGTYGPFKFQKNRYSVCVFLIISLIYYHGFQSIAIRITFFVYF